MEDLGSVEDSAIKEEESVILDNEDNLNLDHVPMVYKAHVAVGIVIFMEGHFHWYYYTGRSFSIYSIYIYQIWCGGVKWPYLSQGARLYVS